MISKAKHVFSLEPPARQHCVGTKKCAHYMNPCNSTQRGSIHVINVCILHKSCNSTLHAYIQVINVCILYKSCNATLRGYIQVQKVCILYKPPASHPYPWGRERFATIVDFEGKVCLLPCKATLHRDKNMCTLYESLQLNPAWIYRSF